LLINYPN